MVEAPGGSGGGEPLDFGPLAESFGLLLRLAQTTAFTRFFEALGKFELSPGELTTLTLISLNPGVRQGVLARQLLIKRPHMTKIIAALEKAELVTRTVPPDDLRSVELWLSPAGQERVAALQGDWLAHEQERVPNLTARETAQLKRLLRKSLQLQDPAEHSSAAEPREATG